MKRKFRSLELTAKTLINSFGSGSHASYLKDSLIDVDVTREYQPGDKKLDSRSSLRTQQTMSRVFAPDKVLTVFLVLDVSASLYSKLDQAITTCLYMTYLADLANDQIALITFSDKVHDFVLPSYDGRNVTPVLEKIYEREAISGISNLDDALLRLGTLEINNTLVVLISDFCYPILERTVRLAKRAIAGPSNKMIALALVNHQEWSLGGQPFTVDFIDAETNVSTWWNFGSKKANEIHQEMFKNWQQELKLKLRQARAEPLVIPVDRSDYLMPLVKYFVRS